MLVTKIFDDKAAAVLFASLVEIHFHRRQRDDLHRGDHRRDGDHKVEFETGGLSCNRSHELVLASNGTKSEPFVIELQWMQQTLKRDHGAVLCRRDFLPFLHFVGRDFCFHFVSRFRRRWRLAGGRSEI